jgi:glycosyltransferase involved in cell wall biosynthesis
LTPRIEVIVAAYNAQDYIAETLESVLAQGPDILIRVVDDGSTDETATIVARYLATDQVKYEHRAHSGSSAATRNVALAAVRAPYVAFFDADDVMLPGHLARHMALLEAHPEWVAIVADFVNFSSAGEYPNTHFASCPKLQRLLRDQGVAPWSGTNTATIDSLTAKRMLPTESFFITGSLLFRTDRLRELGGFDQTLKVSEDFDLFWRTVSQGLIGVSTFCAFRRRLHANNKSNNLLRILAGRVISRKKQLIGETDPQVRQALTRAICNLLSDLAAAEMPADRAKGCRTLIEAARWGIAARALPSHGLKVLIKSWLRLTARA